MPSLARASSPAVGPTTRQQAEPAAQFSCFDGASAAWIMRALVSDPSTFAVFGFFACVLASHGRLNRPNWIRATRRDLEAACRLSSSTVLRALDRLTREGYLTRNGADRTLYRLPPKVFRVGQSTAKFAVNDACLPSPRDIIAVDCPRPKVPRRRPSSDDTVSTDAVAQEG